MGLRVADKMLRDGRLQDFIRARYQSYESGIGQKIKNGTATLGELEAYALAMGDVTSNVSGRQEYLEHVMNELMFMN